MKEYKKIDGYSLSQVVIETGIHKDELFRMAARGEIGLWVWSDSRLWAYTEAPGSGFKEEKGWFMIEGETAGDFIDYKIIEICSFITRQGKKVAPVDNYEGGIDSDVVVPLGMPSKYGMDYDSRARYFGDEPAYVEPHYVVIGVDISREWLRILPHDMERLRQQKGVAEQLGQSATKTDHPKKEYHLKARSNNLMIMAVMIKIITKRDGFDWFRIQGDLETEIAGWSEVPEGSIHKRIGDAKKIHQDPNHFPEYANDRILDEYIIGVFLLLLLDPAAEKRPYSQKDLIEEVNNEENNKFARDEIQKRIKIAASEIKKLKKTFTMK